MWIVVPDVRAEARLHRVFKVLPEESNEVKQSLLLHYQADHLLAVSC